MGSIDRPQPLEIVPSSPQTPIDEKSQDDKANSLIRTRQKGLESLEGLNSSVEITSNTEGKIQEVIFQRSGDDSFDKAFISFAQGHPEVAITMVVNSKDGEMEFAKKIEAANIPLSRCRFIIMGENDNAISVWARDSYVMVKTPEGKNAVMEPRGRTRYPGLGDRDVADRIVATTGEKLIKSPLVFDGGDIRASGKHLFVGAITIVQNIPEGQLATPDNVQRVIEKFHKQFGKEVVVVGFTQAIDERGHAGDYLAPLTTVAEKAEPVFHLDLYFTPLNNNTIAIADPALTKKVLGSMQDSIFVQRKTAGPGLERAIFSALNDFKHSEGSLPNQQQLDKVAANMESKGFKVIRVPYFQDGWYPLSYNNILVENYQEDNKQVTQVSLPQYGIPELDEAAASVYQQAGIKVIPVEGLLPGVYQMGALNCLTSEKRK